MSWGLPQARGRFQGPRDAQEARGASLRLPEAPGRLQGVGHSLPTTSVGPRLAPLAPNGLSRGRG